MAITTEQVKELREKTGVSIMQCKKALEEAAGDFEKASILLRKKGSEVANKKAGRELHAGTIASYIHSDGRIGVLVELLCETDFVAKNKEFKDLADDIAMHVAAMDPQFLRLEEITEGDRAKAIEVFTEETEKLDKPKNVKEKILQGKLDAYFKEKTLVTQSFIKDPAVTIGELLEQAIQKTGERIDLSRFIRFSI